MNPNNKATDGPEPSAFTAKVLAVKPRIGVVELSKSQGAIPTTWHMNRSQWDVQRLCKGLSYSFLAVDGKLHAWAPEPPDAAAIRSFVTACGGRNTTASTLTGKALLQNAPAAMARAGEPEQVCIAANRYLPPGYAALAKACFKVATKLATRTHRIALTQKQVEELYIRLLEVSNVPPAAFVKWLADNGFDLAGDEQVGVGFEILDGLVTGEVVNEVRVRAAALRQLVAAEQRGHTAMAFGRLMEQVAARTGQSRDLVHSVVFDHSDNDSFNTIKDGNRYLVARKITAIRERYCADGILDQAGRRLPFRLELDGSATQLTDDQRAAAEFIARHPLTILTGPAGSGKTTVIRSVAESVRANGGTVAFTATTGQAAKILDPETGTTLHSFLKATPWATVGYANKEVDLLVVDEVSMLDVTLASPLGHYISQGLAERVVLVGDPYQIPPVGAGAVLRDLMRSPKTEGHVVHLNTVRSVKRGKSSAILALAEAIRNDAPLPDLNDRQELEIVSLRSDADPYDSAAAQIVDLVPTAQRPGSDYLVITTVYGSALGVHALARRLRDASLGQSDDAWLVGERVVQHKPLRSDPSDKESPVITNGTFGTITDVRPDGSLHVVYDDNTEADIAAFQAVHGRGVIQSAYAMTVHRAQGGRAPLVVVVVDPSALSMWADPALGYTAVTRASERLVIVGDPSSLRGDPAKRETEKRTTALPVRLSRGSQHRAPSHARALPQSQSKDGRA